MSYNINLTTHADQNALPEHTMQPEATAEERRLSLSDVACFTDIRTLDPSPMTRFRQLVGGGWLGSMTGR